MGSFLDKPKTDKTNENSCGNGLHYGVSAMQGWRIEMEDAHTSKIGLPVPGLDGWSFFGVFDGHAGGTVSKYSSQELLNSILEADQELFAELATVYSLKASSSNSLKSVNSSSSNGNIKSESSSQLSSTTKTNTTTTTPTTNSTTQQHLPPNDQTPSQSSPSASHSPPKQPADHVDSDEQIVEQQQQQTQSNQNNTTTTTNSNNSNNSLVDISKYQPRLNEAIRKGFLDLDDKIRQLPDFDRGDDKSGSTAVACLISPTHVYLINCGDSRAIFVSENKIALSTSDHKPINPNERERIQNAGGSVMIQRVNGSLAVSRALGDYEYKCVEGRGPCEQLVSPEPEIYECERNERDEFLVLACDGIWDVMTNDDLREYIHSRLKVTDDLVKICNEVLDMCLNKGSRDNMSIIIVTFPGAPKIQPDEVERDKLCNEKLESKVKGKYKERGREREMIMRKNHDFFNLDPSSWLQTLNI